MLNLANDLFAFEDGELDDEQVLELFSKLIKNGMAWTLQGFYGRTAMGLIGAGLLSKDGEILAE